MIKERFVEMKKMFILYFVDYTKGSDEVQHATLIELLEELNVNGKGAELIKNLLPTTGSSLHWARLSYWVNIAKSVII